VFLPHFAVGAAVAAQFLRNRNTTFMTSSVPFL
jgi:hypothetical protein